MQVAVWVLVPTPQLGRQADASDQDDQAFWVFDFVSFLAIFFGGGVMLQLTGTGAV